MQKDPIDYPNIQDKSTPLSYSYFKLNLCVSQKVREILILEELFEIVSLI
jgi:hypothetical protein